MRLGAAGCCAPAPRNAAAVPRTPARLLRRAAPLHRRAERAQRAVLGARPARGCSAAWLVPTRAPRRTDVSSLRAPAHPQLSFSTATVYNDGTQYLVGHMAQPTETLNTFSIPITGGAGPCPNGAMRSGRLVVTCSAASTSFSVVESPMCSYAMFYQTTQQCPPGTLFAVPPPSPPPPSPSPQTKSANLLLLLLLLILLVPLAAGLWLVAQRRSAEGKGGATVPSM